MVNQIFVNLPVKDLNKSKDFFGKLGFSFNPQFTDENAACMIVREDAIYVMLLVEKYFQTFAPKPVADAKKSTQVLLALQLPDRKAVDEMVKKAASSGGSTYNEPKDHGFMYQHGFQDPDGHVFEVFHMDMSKLPPEMAKKGA